MDFQYKDVYDINDLLKIMAILRSPGGCPWDREQDHKSIRSNLLEEAYEAAEAIDTGDGELLKEELGDVLLQVVFHSQLESENGGFTFGDVADGIAKKLIVRHPHVFGDVKVKDSEEVLDNWEEIKQRTKGRGTLTQVLNGVSKALPALMRAQKVLCKASKSFGTETEPADAARDICKKAEDFCKAVDTGDANAYESRLGELLLSAVDAAGLLHIEAEQALTKSCDRFISECGQKETAE